VHEAAALAFAAAHKSASFLAQDTTQIPRWLAINPPAAMPISDLGRVVKATLSGEARRSGCKALTILGARMSDFPDVLVPDVAAAVPPPHTNTPEIRAQAADAIIGPIKKAKEESARRASLLDYGPRAALLACLFGFAWLAGSYFSDDQLSFYFRKLWPLWAGAPQESVEHAETIRTTQKMVQEIRDLKADVEAMHATQSLSTKDAAALEGLNTQLNLAKTETSAAIAELAGRVEHLERESAAKLSQIYERLDRMEHQIAAPTAASLAGASESGATVTRKRAKARRSDAFDPSQNPNAPGAPRPLGSLAPAASTNPTAENASGQRAY
jgi:hypothetical protein